MLNLSKNLSMFANIIFHLKNPCTGSPNRDERGRAIDFLGKQFRYKCQVGQRQRKNTFRKDTFRDKENEKDNENKDEDK